ncbi:MAG: transferrin-binding protein-like solute binding protein [Hyphomicrobiales bacterium]
MRVVPVLAFLAISTSLAGCAGGNGAMTLASDGIVCGLPCNDIPGSSSSSSSGGGSSSSSGGGSSSSSGGSSGSSSSGGSDAGGNTTNLKTGNRTIALESGKLILPTTGESTSSLSLTNTTSTASNTAAIASILGTKPSKLKIAVDTNTSTNGNWPVPVLMDEYPDGTNATDPYNAGSAAENGGSGTNYREYRALSDSNGRDETLQVWAWTDSFATQYRSTPGGGEAKQQAWSYGGNKSTDVDTTGTANYTGRFVATAKTANWAKATGADVNPNALWRVQGGSNIDVDFDNASLTGTLTPETWSSYQSSLSSDYTWYTSNFSGTNGATPDSGALTYSGTPTADPKYGFYDTTIAITADIGRTPAKGATPAGLSADYTGTASLDNGFVSGDNPVYGSFFGTGASETTGVFNVYGINPNPVGGSAGINDDQRGYLTINGAFNATRN